MSVSRSVEPGKTHYRFIFLSDIHLGTKFPEYFNERFSPGPRTALEKPRLLCVGRVAVEKNIEAFLSLDLNAEKLVVGDGPARSQLQLRYPQVTWHGAASKT